jgi:hypothetical protein
MSASGNVPSGSGKRESAGAKFLRVVFNIGPKQAPEQAPAANPWVTAAEEAPALSSPSKGVFLGQSGEAERRPAWHWIVRVLVFVALAVVVAVGLRQMFLPSKPAAAPVPVVEGAKFPASDAAGVAARFASAYLSWDQSNPDERMQGLQIDMAGIDSDNTLGWDGKGKQKASAASLVDLDVLDDERAIATVAVYVVPFDAEGKALPGEWTGLAVPLAATEGRVVVSASPATVGIPAPVPVKHTEQGVTDTATSNETQEYIEAFLKAYGAEEDVSAVVAPDADIQGLAGLYTFKTLREWNVAEGDNTTREAVASVVWTTTSGATVEQDYSITLTHVSAGSSGRWQVSAITGRN